LSLDVCHFFGSYFLLELVTKLWRNPSFRANLAGSGPRASSSFQTHWESWSIVSGFQKLQPFNITTFQMFAFE
jgi:hypothetical protein